MSARKKIPTKAELIQLQKLYRTDEKIGERLGGVPAYLVAYWRRKKNVPRHSQPKFSEAEVRNLWERYGDDDKCGLELGISKAAFYNWRRRYGIKEKPAFLKLEQLEFPFPGLKTGSRSVSLYGKRTVAQKILANAAGIDRLEVGDTALVEPDLLVSSHSAVEVLRLFKDIGPEFLHNPNKVFLSLGPDNTEASTSPDDRRLAREFARRQSVRNAVESFEGIAHQLAVERGLALPGQLALGLDCRTTAFGALGTLATVVAPAEMATAWATGKTRLGVPPTIRIDISGRRSRGVYGRDIAISLISRIKANGAAFKAIEFYGSAVTQMSINERQTLSLLSTAMGAVAAMCPFDSSVRRYLNGRTTAQYQPIVADKDAEYSEIFQINIEQLAPQIVCPNGPDQVRAVAEVENLPVDQVIVGTSANGRFEDLRIASEVLKGRQVHRNCRLYVCPASRSVFIEALKKGLIRILAEAGAVILPPGAEPGAHSPIPPLADGECRLSTGVQPAFGQITSDSTPTYFCSPATAAASAVNGAVTDPSGYVK
jgi:3-isopropylmalate/(R)-2-methylmalate dehydratase large subunit